MGARGHTPLSANGRSILERLHERRITALSLLRCLRALAPALLLAPAAAFAQPVAPEVEAVAQVLYDRAAAEMDAKAYAIACPKLEAVTQMVPKGIGARETLAECYEGMGRLASAWLQLELAASMAVRAGDSARASAIAARAAGLKPRVATISIDVPETVRALPGLSIKWNGVALGEALWGAPIPVDVGTHAVEVTAQGYPSFRTSVQIAADGAQEKVQVPPLPEEPARSSPAPIVSLPPSLPGPQAPARTWQRPLGFYTLGLGAAGLGLAGALAGLALEKKRDSDESGHCDVLNRCDDEGLRLRDQAVGLGNGATAALITGGALAAGGIVLLATAPTERKRPEGGAAGFAARIEIASGFVRVHGAW
ncbi:MAG TPA: hypothetical protein VE093_19210 [Polyangiaceae bacterium]|nr:hypothetical protein [Polyangiaceae bacterium]